MNAERDNANERSGAQMNMDYQFLMGHQFGVDNKLYEVRNVVVVDQCVFVDASTVGVNKTDAEKTTLRRFPAATAIESLLVEEEIELFSPTFGFATP